MLDPSLIIEQALFVMCYLTRFQVMYGLFVFFSNLELRKTARKQLCVHSKTFGDCHYDLKIDFITS